MLHTGRRAIVFVAIVLIAPAACFLSVCHCNMALDASADLAWMATFVEPFAALESLVIAKYQHVTSGRGGEWIFFRRLDLSSRGEVQDVGFLRLTRKNLAYVCEFCICLCLFLSMQFVAQGICLCLFVPSTLHEETPRIWRSRLMADVLLQ